MSSFEGIALELIPDFGNMPGVVYVDTDSTKVQFVLSLVLAKVAGETGCTWSTASEIPAELLGVVYQVAARYWNNPRGAIQQTAGPYSARLSDQAADGIYFTGEERKALARYALKPSGLKTISTTRGDELYGTPDWWVVISSGGFL